MTRVLTSLACFVLLVGCTSTPPPTAAPVDTQPPPTATPAPPSAPPEPTPGPTATPPEPTPSPTSEPTTPDPGSELVTAGTLTVCLAIVGPPVAELDETGTPVGYNVSFAEELADRSGLTLSLRQTRFEELLDAVAGHACDASVSSQNITAVREARVSFVAYTRSAQPILVQAGNPLAIDTLDALCGMSVSATSGTTHVDLVRGAGDYVGEGLNETCAAAADQPIDLHTFDTDLEAVQALIDGDVVAYMGNPSYLFDFGEQLGLSAATLPPARQGITVARDHPLLLAAIEDSVEAMIADGTYEAILREHLPNEESVDRVSIAE